MDADEDGVICCFLDHVPIRFMIDSGAPINTVTEEGWQLIKERGARIFNVKTNCAREFKPYASCHPLTIICTFKAWITINDEKPKSFAEIFVVQGGKRSFLCKRTAEELKILKVGLTVQAVEVVGRKHFPKFPNILVKLVVDRAVAPKKVFYYRVPVAVEKTVNDKLKEMEPENVKYPQKYPLSDIQVG